MFYDEERKVSRDEDNLNMMVGTLLQIEEQKQGGMTSATPLGHERQGELDLEDLLREPVEVAMGSASPFLP